MDSEKRETFIPNKFKEYFSSENESDKYVFSNSRNDFAIFPIEQWLHQLKLPIYPHRKSVSSILFLRSGTAKKSCGLDSYEMEKDSVFIVPQGYLNSTQNISADASGFYCHFDFSIFPLIPVKKLKKNFSFLFTDEHPLMRLSPISSEFLSLIFNRLMIESSNNKKDLNFGLISSYLIAAFQEMKLFIPEKHSEEFSRYAQITSDFKELLYNEVRKTKSTSDFAEKLNITPNHLNKSIKTATGQTAKELIHEALILEAKNLLYESDLPIGEIAFELGFSDQAYFSRLFKQLTGTSPHDFRRMIEKSK
ncbi:MAG TPA: helix-turn-helix domain-containing protein [Salinimicrobium sp.]|nr:helix-turn-helix domain-containing protein [Salinimicrobium sp.]